MNYEKPKNRAEMRELKAGVTDLLRMHEREVIVRKLEALGINPDSLPNDAARLEAAGKPKPQTVASYRRRAAGLMTRAFESDVDVWSVVEARTSTAASWYAAKAALQHYLVAELRRHKNCLDEWESAAGRNAVSAELGQRFKAALEAFHLLAKSLATMPRELPASFRQAGGGKRRRSSKSRSLTGLPSNWRLTVASTLPGGLELTYLVQCVTGCRPVELNDVTVRLGPDGQLYTKVLGAKVRTNAGQPERRLRVSADSPIAQRLVELVRGAGGEIKPGLLGGRSVDSYRKLISRRGAKLFGKRAPMRRPTAYSTRHQFKVDAVAAGFSRPNLAAAMGHRTEKSAVYYGGVSKRSGGVVPTAAQATFRVKKRKTVEFRALRASKARGAASSATGLQRRRKPAPK